MKLLHINASPRGADSYSLKVADHFISKLPNRQDVEIDRLDLFSAGLPEFGEVATAAKMALFSGRDQTEEEVAAWDAIRAVFDRFAAADFYVFNVPIWNNGIPYKLKHLIDLVTQPGWSFGFDPASGYTGLMTDRKAVIVHSSGVLARRYRPEFRLGLFNAGPAGLVEFLGIMDVKHIRIQPSVLTADVDSVKAKALDQASETAALLAA